MRTIQDRRKKCRLCGKRKMLSQFYRRKDSRDGYQNECKQCYIQRQNEYNVNYDRPRRFVKISKLSDSAMCDRCKFLDDCRRKVKLTDQEHWSWMPYCFVTSPYHDAYVKEYGNGRKQDYISERVQV